MDNNPYMSDGSSVENPQGDIAGVQGKPIHVGGDQERQKDLAGKPDDAIQGVGRHAIFGDVTIIENLKNTIPAEEFATLEDGFRELKQLIEATDSPSEKAFLSSPKVFQVLLGLDAQCFIPLNEAHFLYDILKRTGIAGKFVTLGSESSNSISFIKVSAAKRILVDRAQEVNIPVSPGGISEMKNEELAELISRHEDEGSSESKNLLVGYLSGFPEDAVRDFAQNTGSHVNLGQQVFMDDEAMSFSRGSVRLTDAQNYWVLGWTNLGIGDKEAPSESDTVDISGFGVRYKSPYPLPQSTIDQCQRLLEIDRRLGLLDYTNSIRRSIQSDLAIPQEYMIS